MKLLIKIASFFDLKNPYLRKTRIFLISIILLCFCGLGITLFAKNQITQTKEQITHPYHIQNAMPQSQFNQQLAKNDPYQTQTFQNAVKNNQGEQYANNTQGSDQNRIYTLSLMMIIKK